MTVDSGEIVEQRLIPHDPHEGGCSAHRDRGEECVCPICNVTWPCPERLRQRTEKKWIDKALHGALYAPTVPRVTIDGYEALRWQQAGFPQWWVDLTYGERGLVVIVHRWDGDHRSDDATAEWLLGVLP